MQGLSWNKGAFYRNLVLFCSVKKSGKQAGILWGVCDFEVYFPHCWVYVLFPDTYQLPQPLLLWHNSTKTTLILLFHSHTVPDSITSPSSGLTRLINPISYCFSSDRVIVSEFYFTY